MFLRVNGLFGWIQANDRRTILLFCGFLAALNVAAAFVLWLPLLAFDPAHAPSLAPAGYAVRYVPVVTLAAAGVFGLQLLWHVQTVQRSVAFAFVDDAEEPRLCRLVEPLAITMGLPTPYVGVIETRALNAFACGLSRRNAVVVVTRGLIEALDDDELAAVIAHELAHIANGDIRLLAAANACLRMIDWLVLPQRWEANRLREVLAFPMVVVVMPPLLLFILSLGFCGQCILRGSRLIRLLITASREFVADARAVEVTQNPAALLSALERIEGRSGLAALRPGQDAMMIDGACEGAFATHPPIARRVAAIVAVTGSLAFVAPPRRDTRARGLQSPACSPIRASLYGTAVRVPERGALARIGADDPRNWLGLTPAMTVGAVLAAALFLGLHWRDLGRPEALVTALDPRPAAAIFTVAAQGTACSVAILGQQALALPLPARCEAEAMQNARIAQAAVAGPAGAMLKAMAEPPEGMYSLGFGTFSSVPPPAVEAAEVQSKRCFRTRGYTPGEEGWHRVDAPPRHDGAFNIRRWLAHAEDRAEAAGAAAGDAADKPLKEYIEARKLFYEKVDHFFGEPGLTVLRAAYASPAHRRALERLRERLADPRWAAAQGPVALAEARLLATNPEAFVTCMARARMAAGEP
ncbi:M48 family metalloprotease [Methylobacterium sp. Gmos1]